MTSRTVNTPGSRGQPLRALIIEDSEPDADLIIVELERGGYHVVWERVQTAEAMTNALQRATWDVILSDYNLPSFSAPAALDLLKTTGQDLPFLVISGTIDEEAAIAALKAGAHDFFVKNRLSRLIPAVERALADVATRRDRERAQAALRRSEARKAAVLDSVLDCIVTIDAAGNVIELNAAAERTFGYTKAEAMGRPLADLIIPPALRHAHRAGLAHYLATGEGPLLGKLVEVTAIRADGTEFPVELAITSIRSDGPPIFTGVLRDITARQQTHETLARLAAIVTTSDDAILSTSLDGIVLTWNAGAERLYGYSASDMIGQNMSLFVPTDKLGELLSIFQRVSVGERVDSFETQRMRRDGSRVDISLTVSPITDPNGHVIGASTIARNITERKQAEAEMRRLNAEIQRQRLRVFKATMTTVHDIVNNFLNSLQLIRLESEGRLPVELLTLFDGMIAQAAMELRTLGDLETINEKEMEIGTGIDYPSPG
jgi:two-component system, cell cycle sensor histidine kinase and response regulator CckA